MRNKTAFLLICSTFCFIAACGKPTSAQPSLEIQAMMKNTKPFCVGRYLIDLPADAEFVGQTDKYGSFDITHKYVTSGTFDDVIKARTAELNEDVDRREGRWNLGVTSLKEGRAVIFRYGGESVGGGPLFKLEGYIRLAGYDIKFYQGAMNEQEVIEEKQKLERILTTIQPRHPNQIFDKPGVCIERAFIPDGGPPEKDRDEYFEGVFHLPSHRDISVQFRTNIEQYEDVPLLARGGVFPVPDALKNLFSQVKTIRSGEREIGSLRGQEILYSLPVIEGGRHHLFLWESHGKPHDIDAPLVNLEFKTGMNENYRQRLPSRLPENQAIELFDQILNTIRLRPMSEPKPVPLPLGMQLSSRDICLQTGIWECAEPVLAYGKRQRRFEAGNRMPVVVVWGEPYSSKWRKWLGLKEEDPVETTWTLVAYDEPSQG